MTCAITPFPTVVYQGRVNHVIAPYIADRGYDWELHIDETPFDYWSINGHYPPREGTEDEKRWKAENRTSPLTNI